MGFFRLTHTHTHKSKNVYLFFTGCVDTPGWDDGFGDNCNEYRTLYCDESSTIKGIYNRSGSWTKDALVLLLS